VRRWIAAASFMPEPSEGSGGAAASFMPEPSEGSGGSAGKSRILTPKTCTHGISTH
jgi:hypothetical protein